MAGPGPLYYRSGEAGFESKTLSPGPASPLPMEDKTGIGFREHQWGDSRSDLRHMPAATTGPDIIRTPHASQPESLHCPRPSWPPAACGSHPAHLLFTCLIEHPLPRPSWPSASHAEKVQTVGQGHKSPRLAEHFSVRSTLAGGGQERPCQLFISCCCCGCCWAPPGCSHQKLPKRMGTEVASTRPYHSEHVLY